MMLSHGDGGVFTGNEDRRLSCTFRRHFGDMPRNVIDVVTLPPTFPVFRPKCCFEGFVSTYVETYQIGPSHHLLELFLHRHTRDVGTECFPMCCKTKDATKPVFLFLGLQRNSYFTMNGMYNVQSRYYCVKHVVPGLWQTIEFTVCTIFLILLLCPL